jgi:hypothetical protein
LALQYVSRGAATRLKKYVMQQWENDKTSLEQAGQSLFDFAVDREDVKTLVAHLHEEAKCKPAAVEYELQLLKIVATGWSISFFMEGSPYRDQLAEIFWKLIHAFSADLSETTGLMTGRDIDYFETLKDRLDMYVAALQAKPEMSEPAAVIGPEFARLCGNTHDVFTIMTGSRMFIITVAQVKDYLDSLLIDQES